MFIVKYLNIPFNTVLFVVNRIRFNNTCFPYKSVFYKNNEQVFSLLCNNVFNVYLPHDRCCNCLIKYLANKEKLENCFYIEEGNLSYNNSRYKYSERKFLKIVYNLPVINLFTRHKTFFYGNAAYALNKNAFPFLDNNKKRCFNFKEVIDSFLPYYNFHSLKNSYLFLLSVNDNFNKVKNIIASLKGENIIYLKFHPSFNHKDFKILKENFIKTLLSSYSFIVCDESFFVELESFYKNLVVYGGSSSSQRYFNYLGLVYNKY